MRRYLAFLISAIALAQQPAPAPRSSTGSPVGRDACAKVGEPFFQTDAAAGAKEWACTAIGSPGTWEAQGGSGGGGATIPSTSHVICGDGSGNGALCSPDLAPGSVVPTSRTVNGHALSGNVTVSATDLTTGTLPHAQLPALVSGDIPNNAANTSGQAGSVPGFTAGAAALTGPAVAATISQTPGANQVPQLDSSGNLSIGARVLAATGDTLADISTPANPTSGNTKTYAKGGKLCSLDSSGNENCTGASGGSGTVNNSSTAGALGYYAATGTAISKTPAWTLDPSTKALVSNQGTPGNYTYFSFPNNTTIGGDTTAPFQFVNTNVNYTTYSDNVFEFGYNCAPGSAPVAGHQVFCWTLESSFNSGTTQQMEFYYTFGHPDGTGTRIFGFTPSISSGNHTILGNFTVTDLQFYNPANITTPFLDITPGLVSFNGTSSIKFNRNNGTAQTFIATQGQSLLRIAADESVTVGPDFPLGAGTNLYPSAIHTSYTMPLNFGDRKIQWTSGTGFQFQDYGGTLHSFAAAESALPAGVGVYSSYRGAGSLSGVGSYNEVGNLQINNGFSDTSSVDVEMSGTNVAAARWTVMIPANNGSGNGNWYQVEPMYYSANPGYIIYLDARISSNVLYLRTRRGDASGGGSVTFYVTTHGLNSSAGTNTWTFTSASGTGATVTGLWTGSITTPYYAVSTTGSGSVLLGSNSPATTNTAPYQWLTVLCSDGSTCYVPAWK